MSYLFNNGSKSHQNSLYTLMRLKKNDIFALLSEKMKKTALHHHRHTSCTQAS